jgi:RES domain-containing protein
VVSCTEILDPSLVHVVAANDVPNASWLRPGTPSHGQQRFGKELLEQHVFVAVPSAVLSLSWNIVFNPRRAAGAYELRNQTDLELDMRLNRPPS